MTLRRQTGCSVLDVGPCFWTRPSCLPTFVLPLCTYGWTGKIPTLRAGDYLVRSAHRFHAHGSHGESPAPVVVYGASLHLDALWGTRAFARVTRLRQFGTARGKQAPRLLWACYEDGCASTSDKKLAPGLGSMTGVSGSGPGQINGRSRKPSMTSASIGGGSNSSSGWTVLDTKPRNSREPPLGKQFLMLLKELTTNPLQKQARVASEGRRILRHAGEILAAVWLDRHGRSSG